MKIFFFFGWVSKNCLFSQLGPKSAHPKNTIEIGVSATHFVENSSESRNGHFWTKKSQIQKFQLSFFFLLFSSLTTTKNTKISWNPYFYSVLAHLKKENFQNWNLKHRKLKNPNFAPFFWKRLFLENWLIIGNKKTHNDNWAQKIAWNPYFYSAKMTLAKILTLTWPKYWLWKPSNLAKILTSQHIYIYAVELKTGPRFPFL